MAGANSQEETQLKQAAINPEHEGFYSLSWVVASSSCAPLFLLLLVSNSNDYSSIDGLLGPLEGPRGLLDAGQCPPPQEPRLPGPLPAVLALFLAWLVS